MAHDVLMLLHIKLHCSHYLFLFTFAVVENCHPVELTKLLSFSFKSKQNVSTCLSLKKNVSKRQISFVYIVFSQFLQPIQI